MRGKRELLMRKSTVDKDLIRRYDASVAENTALSEGALDELRSLTGELSAFAKERSKKKREENKPTVEDLVLRCDNLLSRISWYMHLVKTGADGIVQMLDKTSPKEAKKKRIVYGKQRVAFLEKNEKAEAEYKKVCGLLLAEASK